MMNRLRWWFCKLVGYDKFLKEMADPICLRGWKPTNVEMRTHLPRDVARKLKEPYR